MAEESEEECGLSEEKHVQVSVLRKCRRKSVSEPNALPVCFEDEPHSCGKWRSDAFHTVWRQIESTVQTVLEEKNLECFKGVEQWIFNRQFCKAQLDLYMSQKTCPGVAQTTVRRLSSAILFSGSVDSSDSIGIFDGLSAYLKKQNRCQIARLQSEHVSSKAGVNAALRILFKQFIGVNPETTDMEILAAWHREPLNNGSPMVIMIEDMEHCNSLILSELLMILSEWSLELPLIMIFGMATIGDSLETTLPSSVINRLHLQCFRLKSPVERLEAVIQTVFIEMPCIFTWGSSMVKYFYEFFYTHDNTLTSFLRLLKMSCMEHFCKQPLSFLCVKLIESTTQEDLEGVCNKLPQALLKYAASLLSENDDKDLRRRMVEELWTLKTNRRNWSMAVHCFIAVSKYIDFKFADVFYGVLTSSKPSVFNDYSIISQIIEKMRYFPTSKLSSLLTDWMSFAAHNLECSKQLEAMEKQLETGSGTPSEKPSLAISSSTPSRRLRNFIPLTSVSSQEQNRDNAGILIRLATKFLEHLRRNYLIAPETLPFNEVFCFRDVNSINEALTGETRKHIHGDLLHSQAKLKCDCCPADGSLSSSLHDTSIAYILCQEHNELINVHDWYTSFETILCETRCETGSSKKRGSKRKKLFTSDDQISSASNQAAFCKAVAELHVTGVVRLPKKRNPDSVQRIVLSTGLD